MATKNYAAKLKQAQKAWEKTDAASGSSFTNENVEDGRYKAKIVGHEVAEMGQNLVEVVSLEIVDSDDCEGEVVKARYNLTKEGMAFLKRDLTKLNVEIDDLAEELEEKMTELVEREVIVGIMVRTKDDFQNVYLNKVLEGEVDGGDDDDDDDKKDKKSGKKGGKKKDDDDDKKDDDVEFEKGDKVKHKKLGVCTVKKVTDDGLVLIDEDEDRHEDIDPAKCEKVEDDDDDDDDKKDKKSGKKKDDDKDEGEAELKKGMKVIVQYKGKDEDAKIVSLDEKEEEVTVKLTDKGNKEVTVSVGDVEIP